MIYRVTNFATNNTKDYYSEDVVNKVRDIANMNINALTDDKIKSEFQKILDILNC